MIEKLYSRLDLELATLSTILIVSGALSALLEFTPLLRLSSYTLLFGLLGGLLIVVLEVAITYLTNRKKKKWSLESHFSRESLNNVSIAKVIIQSAGEETLLRGFIFIPLINALSFFGSTWIILAVNAFISIVIYSSREKIAYFAGIQATVLGIIYLSTHSMFAVIVARFIGEFSLLLASHYRVPHLLVTLLLNRFSYVSK